MSWTKDYVKTYTGAWSKDYAKTYVGSGGGSGTAYRYWRIYVTATNRSDGKETALGELELFVGDTEYPTSDMTSMSAPSPLVCTESSNDGSSRQGFNIFDGDISNTDSHWGSQYNQSFPQWVAIDLGSGNAIDVTSYKVYAGVDGKQAHMIKSWQLQGSNDGTNWTTVDTQTDQTGVDGASSWNPGNTAGGSEEYSITSDTNYVRNWTKAYSDDY